jgi:hypothetical protein
MAEPMPDHVVSTPGDQRQRRHAHDRQIVDGLAVDLGVQQCAHQVVARMGAPILELLEQIERQGVAAAGGPSLLVGELEEVLYPAGERVGHLLRHAEHQRDDPDRDLTGIVARSVGGAVVDETVDQAVAQLPGERLVLRDTGVGEPRQHQSARPGVVRLILVDRWERDLDRRRRALLVVEGQDADVAGTEPVMVLGETLDVGVASRQPRPAPSLGVGDRTLLAQVVPHGIRIGHVVAVEDVVVGRPVVHGRLTGAVGGGVVLRGHRVPLRLGRHDQYAPTRRGERGQALFEPSNRK